RLDDQIKIRGYRVELGEIENRLKEIPGIREAAVTLCEEPDGEKFLSGYAVISENADFDESKIKADLAKTLPPYMVPAFIQKIIDLPRLTSGKVNRKALPKAKVPPPASGKKDPDANATPAEKMALILEEMFPGQNANLENDFFEDLGGHSLLAATLVSRLRKEAGIPKASLRDLYLHRPLREAFAEWEKKQEVSESSSRTFSPTPWWRHLTCASAQTIALPFIYGFFAAQILLPYLGYYYVQDKTGSYTTAVLAALFIFCTLPPVFTALTIALKWLVIGKIKAGDYPLWGSYYFRWWLVKTLQRLMPVHFITGTPLYPIYLRLLGAKIAPDVQLSPIQIGAEDLISIGSDASLGSGTNLNNAWVEDGLLKLREIVLGEHSYLGSGAVVSGDTRVEDWGELRDLSCLPRGGRIAEGEVWIGSPAKKEITRERSAWVQPLAVSKPERFRYQLLFTFFLLIFPFMILLPLLPSIIILNILDDASGDYDFTYLLITPGLALIYILVFASFAVLLTRLLLRGIKPGTFSLYSFRYVRKWFADQIMSLSLMVLHPIYATVFVGTLFRALGAKVGKNTEISTANSVTHPLLAIGDGAFVADAVTLGELEVRGQRMILDTTSVGNNSFLGNSALLPQGTHLPENTLIGVLSTPPSPATLAEVSAKDWFGSPAIALPRREKSKPFDESLTIRPSVLRRTARGLVELVRILIPQTAVFCFSILFIAYTHDLLTETAWWQILLLFPFYYLGFVGIPAFLVVLVFKWVFVGRYRAEQMPMWTWKVWRSEAVTAIYEAISVPFLLDYCRGTPWLPVLLRLLGTRVGKKVWMNTTDLTEFDMVAIGDEAALGEDSGPQTHLFEDRVMKVGRITIGARTTVGAHSVILYDSEIGENVLIEALSLVMKGERLASGTRWSGSPVRPIV
ncbi:MAG: peptide synthetase, partial [Spirochaetia bacterium]|nr:peptide synthetase [Spirochaetia bacterium]